MKIHVSKGNSKMGKIPSFSLLPGVTCSKEACATCLKEGCYAAKLCRIYPTVRNAYTENTDLVRNGEFMQQMFDWLNKYRPAYFRVHVSGDFDNVGYACCWAELAERFPGTQFLAFTKQFDIVRSVTFPDNFRVVLSSWGDSLPPEDLMQRYPVTYVDDGKTAFPEDTFRCAGDCEHCRKCWEVGAGESVTFGKH